LQAEPNFAAKITRYVDCKTLLMLKVER